MEIYLDTADLNEIKSALDLGVLRGITTNPTHLMTAGHPSFEAAIREICTLSRVPVSAEVTGTGVSDMHDEAREIATWHENVVVKIPTTLDGLRVMRKFSQELHAVNSGDGQLERRKVPINATVIFSAGQAVAASLAGASYVSPFVGRLDSIGHDGCELVRQIADIFSQHRPSTRIISAALRNPNHAVDSWRAGAEICTMGYGVLEQLLRHPLTEEAVELFANDWARFVTAGKGV